ncbi:putative acetyltransferase [Clostridium tepidiprofundi DSM 19306]|uniref:Putative acetyltransferase n=1 Tax=Clostridium tepidiprofundi DSM 19306 TaxID=1121338 RepID=A0A151AUI1_9CLOT|nr:acyltransferase [Clostridium tepidiprofundi]KYH31223.1 putative acetyltransferase [Clostridium tepidiprofundi DSM 19306]
MISRKVQRVFLRMVLKLIGPQKRADFIKKRNILYYVGKNCSFTTVDFGNEPYLISIHDNVEIASDVTFITHDNSCFLISRYLKLERRLDKVGSIEIFDNCFIGAKSIIMPNVKIGPNSIVAAGSIVTKDVPKGTIVAGNPAKVICTIDEYANKLINTNKNFKWREYLKDPRRNKEIIIESRKKYFWND